MIVEEHEEYWENTGSQGAVEGGRVNPEGSVVVVAADQNSNREINAAEEEIDENAPPNVNIFAPELEWPSND